MADEKTNKITRRDVLKGLATTPVLGYFAYDYWKEKLKKKTLEKAVSTQLGITNKAPAILPKSTFKEAGEVIRIGVVGCGVRGPQLLRAAGLTSPGWHSAQMKGIANNDKGAKDRLQTYYNQPDLNFVVNGICDVFDNHAEKGIEIAKSGYNTSGKQISNNNVKRFRTYHEMLESKDIDAIMIATPDFHHAQMTIDAVNAGKHVYCEKAMTLTEDEIYKVVDTVKASDIVFQLGNQNSESAVALKAREVIQKNILGKVTLIETTTNRNSKAGAWIRHLDNKGRLKPGSPETIDWKQWLGNTPQRPFDIEVFYGWARWFLYDTGLAGQLFSHEVDFVNQTMGFSIPDTVTSSGGIYFHKEGRDMPDTFNSMLEFKDKEFTMMYSASLANGRNRGRVFMGHDATMEAGGELIVTPERESTKYKEQFENGLISPNQPVFQFPKGGLMVDGITSASERYYAERGLVNTLSAEGTKIDVTHLHVKDWFNAIRNGTKPSCDIDKAFMNTLAVIMVHKSYVEGRPVRWDKNLGRIV